MVRWCKSMKIKFKTVAVSGTGNVHLGLCRSGVPGNCPAGEIGIPIGFIPGIEYNDAEWNIE